MPEHNPAMSLSDMRKMLKTGAERPLNCAFGNVKNQAALTLDLRASPMILARQLQTSLPDLKEPCHGRALRDPQDAKHLQLDVNRGTAGTAKKLTKTLHGTGIRRVSILMKDELFETAESEEPEEEGTASSPASPLSTGPSPGTSSQGTSSQGASSSTAPGGDSPAKDVLGKLSQLAKSVAGASAMAPDQKTALVTQLRQAQGSAMGGDLATARGIIATIEQSLSVGSSSSTPSGSPGIARGGAWASATARSGQPGGARGVSLGRQPVTGGNGAAPLAPQPIQGVNQQSATFQAQQGFAQALHAAQGDIKAAQGLPAHPGLATGKQNLAQIVSGMTQQAAAKDFAGATQSAARARGAALKLSGQARTLDAQQQSYDRMSPVLDKVEKSYFTKTSNDALRLADLKAGPEFQGYVASVSKFEQDRTPQACDEVVKAANGYIGHYYNELSPRQQNTRESQAKLNHAQTGAVAARHMKMALELKQFGPPPWDADTASKVASMRAAFAFEDVGKPASPLGDDSGISASFWLKGYDLGSDDPAASNSEFLFKPVQGEEDQPGFELGGSAPREVASKAMADLVRGQTGLDLGVPETNIVTVHPRSVDIDGFNERKHAKTGDQEGQLPTDQLLPGSMQQFVGSKGMLKDQPPGTSATMPVAQCQRAGILDILTLNCDRHAGNFMVGDATDATGTTTDTLVPIDHGLTLPTRKGLRLRGKDRMNNPAFNALLKMPGSYAPFTPDHVERIDLIDPDALAAGMKESVASLDRVQPALRAAELLPDESIELAKRSAMFLKRACRQLSPAEIQIAMASKQAEIFDVSEQNFAQSADAVIAGIAAKSAAIKTLFCDRADSMKTICIALRASGWIPWNSDFNAKMELFRVWLVDHADTALAAYDNNTAPPQGWVMPPD